MRKRKLLLLSLISLVGCVLIIVLLPSIFKKQVSKLLLQEINQQIKGDVIFTDADINLWRHFPHFTVTLENFSLTGKNEFKSDTLLQMKELHMVLGSVKLIFNDEVEIRELNLISPSFHIIELKNGMANYDVMVVDSTESENESDMKMDIESCTIENGRFIYEDHVNEFVMKGSGVALTGVGDIRGNIYDLNIRSKIQDFTTIINGETYVDDKSISFDFEAAYDVEKQTLTFNDNEININHLKLGIVGVYAFRNDDQFFDVKFHANEANFRDLLSLNNDLFAENYQGIDIKGHLNLTGEFKGTYNSNRNIIPSFKIDFLVKDGFIKYDGLSSSINDINFNLTAENKDSIPDHTIIDMKSFTMKLGQNPFHGSFTINGFKNGHLKTDILAKINLDELADIYPLPGVKMKGKLDLNLKADGPYSGKIERLHKNKLGTIPKFDISLAIKNGHFKYDHLPEAISNVHLDLKANNTSGNFDETLLNIERVEALFGDNPVKGHIRVDGLKNPVINSDIKANLDLAEIENFFPIKDLSLKGLFNLDMKVYGKWSEADKKFPMVDAKVYIANGFIKSSAYPFPMEETHLKLEALNTTGNLRDTRIHIDTLTYSIEDESFFINGYLINLEKYSYHLDIKGTLYLDKLKKILHLDDFSKMAGEIDVNFKTSGNYRELMAKNYHKLPTSGQVTMKNIMLAGSSLPNDVTIKSGHLFFSNEKIVLDTLHGSIGNSNFNLTGHFYNYMAYLFHQNEEVKGDLLLVSDTFNLSEITSQQSHSSDSTGSDLTVFKIPENINFTFDTQIGQLIYNNITFNNLKGEITMKNGVMSLNETTFSALDAAFNLAGDYDTRDIEHPLFDVDIKIDELDINKAHKAFATVQAVAPAAEDTYGIFSVDYKLKGELMHNLHPVFQSLEGSGTVKIREAKVNGMKVFHHISGITKKDELKNPELKNVVMETVVAEGIIYVKPFSMKLAGFDTDIEGKHNIHGDMNYIVRMGIPPFDIVKIPLHVNGTYDNPKIHLGKGHEDVFKSISDAASNK
jgi:AsmA protein